jgi:hypothetical protein
MYVHVTSLVPRGRCAQHYCMIRRGLMSAAHYATMQLEHRHRVASQLHIARDLRDARFTPDARVSSADKTQMLRAPAGRGVRNKGCWTPLYIGLHTQFDVMGHILYLVYKIMIPRNPRHNILLLLTQCFLTLIHTRDPRQFLTCYSSNKYGSRDGLLWQRGCAPISNCRLQQACLGVHLSRSVGDMLMNVMTPTIWFFQQNGSLVDPFMTYMYMYIF